MQNYLFFRNLTNGCPFTTLEFNATNYYNTYKDSLTCYTKSQDWQIGSTKDNAILFLKNKPLYTCVNIDDSIFINFEGTVVKINLSI